MNSRPGHVGTADEILADLDARATLQSLHGVKAEGPTWDGEPVPLSVQRALPAFPTDALPGWLADQVTAVAEATQTPPDLAGCVALAVLATAAGGRVSIEARSGWIEPTNLYLVVAMPPGSRKSAVFAAMTAPVLEVERALVEATRPAIAEAKLAERVARDHAEQTARAATHAATEEARTAALAEASAAAIGADAVTVPVQPQLVADDVTPEAAATLLAQQQGRLAILSDEGGIFGTLAGRYTGQANLDVFLKGHSGASPLRVHRVGREPEYVEHPALTLGLTVQPSVLRDIARISGARDRGLLARILYALPTNTVGRRIARPPAVPADVAHTYDTRMRALTHTLAELSEQVTLAFSDEADERLLRFERELEPQLGESGALGHVADWGSKLAGASIRLAGLLHVGARIRDGWGSQVDATTFDQATRLAQYYLAHALAVFDHMGADPVVTDARYILDWIARAGGRRFTKRDLFTGVSRSRFPKASSLDAPLGVLEQSGHIQRADPDVSGPGRRSITYAVHPSVVTGGHPP